MKFIDWDVTHGAHRLFLLRIAGVALWVYRGVICGGVTGLGWGAVRRGALLRGWSGCCEDDEQHSVNALMKIHMRYSGTQM